MLVPVDPQAAPSGERIALDEAAVPDISRCSIDRLATSLLPTRVIRRDEPSRAQTAIFLGLESPPTGVTLPPWMSQTDVARVLDLTRARIGQVIARARERWAKQPDLNHLRDDVSMEGRRVALAPVLVDDVEVERVADDDDVFHRASRVGVVAAAAHHASEPATDQEKGEDLPVHAQANRGDPRADEVRRP